MSREDYATDAIKKPVVCKCSRLSLFGSVAAHGSARCAGSRERGRHETSQHTSDTRSQECGSLPVGEGPEDRCDRRVSLAYRGTDQVSECEIVLSAEPETMNTYHGQIHDLKCHPWAFTLLERGVKPFDLRKDDRGFKEGDLLIQREWDPDMGEYSGHVIVAAVTCVVRGGEWLAPGYVALGIRILG